MAADPAQKIKIIKEVRQLLGLGLKEVSDFVCILLCIMYITINKFANFAMFYGERLRIWSRNCQFP